VSLIHIETTGIQELNFYSKLKNPVISSGVFPVWPGVLLVYEVTMNINAGNDLQGMRPVVSFNVFAEQTANNPWIPGR